MTGRFRVTYEIVTDESAAHGDAAERGFVLSGEWHVNDHGNVTLYLAMARGKLREVWGVV